jgi:hypothetical protein
MDCHVGRCATHGSAVRGLALLFINAGRAAVDDTAKNQALTPATRVTSPSMLRFAVAAFDTWAEAQNATQVLRSGSKPLCQISYLGLRNVLSDGPRPPLRDLPFPGSTAPISCSAGPIADRLSAKLTAGALSLQAALTSWLIPRHAAQLQRAVESGKIVVWVALVDHDDEQSAYRTLLSAKCNSVSVHDLAAG